jgi:hypothetical protein
MGNVCPSKKEKPILNIESKIDNFELRQIMIITKGDCNICDTTNTNGTEITHLIENKKLFICDKCSKMA